MSFQRGIDGSDPVRPEAAPVAGPHERRRSMRSTRLSGGTLACPRCDAPVALGAARRSPADRLHCPFCRHAAPLRDFLSLAAPTRPARVEVHVVRPDREASQ